MKKLIAIFALLLSANTAQAQRAVNERRAVVPDGFIRIFILNGSVTVKGWDKDSLAVVGSVYEPPGEKLGVGVTAKGAKVGLWADDGVQLKPSTLTIWVPARSQVWVKTTDANISVDSVNGGLDLFSVSGSIEVGGAPSEVYAETMAGEINLHAATRSARVKTAAGGIVVSGKVMDLNAVSVSGRIQAAKLDFAKARLETVDGNIRFNATLPKGSATELITHAGDIEVVLARNASAEFMVSQYSGAFVDRLTNRKRTTPELKFATSKTPLARVTLRTFKGRILLRHP